MIIVGIDTGLFTGMAWISTLDLFKPPVAVEVPARETGITLRHWLQALAVDYIACEKYVMTGGIKTPQPEALMQMGVVEDAAMMAGKRLFWQFPKEAKTMCTDALLRRLGWYVKTKDGHANDGIRHCVLWLAHNEPEEYAKLLGI